MRCWSCCALPLLHSARNGCDGGPQSSAAAAGAADRSVGVAASGPVPGTAAPRVPTVADVDRSAWVPSADSATAEVSGAAAGAAWRGADFIDEPYPWSGPPQNFATTSSRRRILDWRRIFATDSGGPPPPSHLVAEFVTGDVVLPQVRMGRPGGRALRRGRPRYGPRGLGEPPPDSPEPPVGQAGATPPGVRAPHHRWPH